MTRDRRIRVHALIDALGCGGAEMLLPEFAAAAPTVGIDLTVGYLQEVLGSPAAERLRRLEVEPELVPVSSLLKPSDHLRVRRHIAAVAPDLVHTHLGTSDVLGQFASRALRVPVLSTLHATDWHPESRRSWARMRLSAIARRRCAARVVAVSESARRHYLETGWDIDERVVTITNGVGGRPCPGSGAAVRTELGIGTEETVVAMVSALRPEKGHAAAIAAIGELSRHSPGLRLLIAGDGPGKGEVARLAESAGSAVVMAGYRDDVMAVLDAADVLLHPSFHEAFPTTLLEAMAASVAIVATAVGGIPEMIEDGVTGVLLEAPPTADGIRRALADVLVDGELRRRLAAAGRERFATEFTLERWVERTRDLYDEVLDARGSLENGSTRLPARQGHRA